MRFNTIFDNLCFFWWGRACDWADVCNWHIPYTWISQVVVVHRLLACFNADSMHCRVSQSATHGICICVRGPDCLAFIRTRRTRCRPTRRDRSVSFLGRVFHPRPILFPLYVYYTGTRGLMCRLQPSCVVAIAYAT